MNFNLFPDSPGVYLMKSKTGAVLYVGKAKSLKNRIKQYFTPGRDERPTVPLLICQVESIDTIVVLEEKEALLLENTLIKKHQPRFNILLKDDKNFISLTLNHKHPWPMLRLVRTKSFKSKQALFFGPYTNAYAARRVFELMGRLFQLRQCSDTELRSRTRPCLLHSIKRCLAPCVKKCTSDEYQNEVSKAVNFLQGKNKVVLQELRREMTEASENLDFEKAGSLLKTIRQIEEITTTASSLVIQPGLIQADVIGLARDLNRALITQLFFREGNLVGMDHYSFNDVIEEDAELITSFLLQHYTQMKGHLEEIFLPTLLKNSSSLEAILQETLHRPISISYPQRGEKRKCVEMANQNAESLLKQEKEHLTLRENLLLDFQEICMLTRYPKRIESFDTSNLSGSNLVSAMITFFEGSRDKQRTRLFRVKTVSGPDDYGALKEVLRRRYTKAKEEDDLPDLVLLDGGKGQLNAAHEVFNELLIANVDIVSIAKENARHDKGMTRERLFVLNVKEPLLLDAKSPLLLLLQKIRDETHRAAIMYHRKSRSKALLTSELDTLPGIGPIKRKRLLIHFGSVKNIKNASQEELKKVLGITQKTLRLLKSFPDLHQIEKII